MTNDGNVHQRNVHNHDETPPNTLPANHISAPSSPVPYTTKNHDHEFGEQFATALTIGGMGLSLFMTIFALFHVDVFLRVYRLPLQTYSTGNVIITLVNTANSLVGAYLLDAAATKMNRSDLIGISGSVLAVCFL